MPAHLFDRALDPASRYYSRPCQHLRLTPMTLSLAIASESEVAQHEHDNSPVLSGPDSDAPDAFAALSAALAAIARNASVNHVNIHRRPVLVDLLDILKPFVVALEGLTSCDQRSAAESLRYLATIDRVLGRGLTDRQKDVMVVVGGMVVRACGMPGLDSSSSTASQETRPS